MRNTILTILFIGASNLCFGQYYQNKCDSIWTCHHEEQFANRINRFISRLKSDTILVVATYGGVGCQTRNLMIFYRRKGSNQVKLYKNKELQRKTKLDPDYKEHLNSFFDDKLYMTADTVANKNLYIDDGQTTKVMYRVGEYCGTYSIYPQYNENEVYEWVSRARFPELKK